VIYLIKALLRRLGILPRDELYEAGRRHKEAIKAIRRRHGFTAAHQAMDESEAMAMRMRPTPDYPPAQMQDDMTEFLRSKYLSD
jgi:hypothetical protein